MAWLMLCVALWDKPVITVSLYAPLVCQFCSIRKEKTIEFHVCVWKALSMSLFNIPVSLLGGRLCFSCMDSLCLSFLKKKKFLQNFNESNSFPEDKIAVIHTFLSFFVFLFLPPSHTDVHAHTWAHTYTNVHVQTHKKKATLFLSALMSLGTIKSLP